MTRRKPKVPFFFFLVSAVTNFLAFSFSSDSKEHMFAVTCHTEKGSWKCVVFYFVPPFSQAPFNRISTAHLHLCDGV